MVATMKAILVKVAATAFTAVLMETDDVPDG